MTGVLVRVLAKNDDLPIRTDQPVHSGKVRSVYWLTSADSQRLIRARDYDVPETAELAVMIMNAANCASRSGDVLNKTQSTAFELTAIEDCVRAVALMRPVRKP